MKHRAILTILILLAPGCHSLTIVPREDLPRASATDRPDLQRREGSYLFGIFEVRAHEVEVACGKAPPEVRIRTGFVDNVIHFLIGPAYTTKSVEVYCRR